MQSDGICFKKKEQSRNLLATHLVEKHWTLVHGQQWVRKEKNGNSTFRFVVPGSNDGVWRGELTAVLLCHSAREPWCRLGWAIILGHTDHRHCTDKHEGEWGSGVGLFCWLHQIWCGGLVKSFLGSGWHFLCLFLYTVTSFGGGCRWVAILTGSYIDTGTELWCTLGEDCF